MINEFEIKKLKKINKDSLIKQLNIKNIKWVNEPYYPNAIKVYINKKPATILFTKNDELMYHTTPNKNALKAISDLFIEEIIL